MLGGRRRVTVLGVTILFSVSTAFTIINYKPIQQVSSKQQSIQIRCESHRLHAARRKPPADEDKEGWWRALVWGVDEPEADDMKDRWEQQRKGVEPDRVDGHGMLRTALLWSLLHGPFLLGGTIPAMLLAGKDDNFKGITSTLKNFFTGQDEKADGPAKVSDVSSETPPDWTPASEVSRPRSTVERLNLPCACGSGRSLRECCHSLHTGKSRAKTATQLLAARFSAYAVGKALFIVDSTARDSEEWQTDADAWLKDIRRYSDEHEMLSIDIGPEESLGGSGNEDLDGIKGTSILFTCEMIEGGVPVSFTERSLFVRIVGRWYYAGGELVRTQTMQVPRRGV